MIPTKTFKIEVKKGIVAVIEVRTEPSGQEINAKITIGLARQQRSANPNLAKAGIKKGAKESKVRKSQIKSDGFALCIQHLLKHLKTHSLNIKID